MLTARAFETVNTLQISTVSSPKSYFSTRLLSSQGPQQVLKLQACIRQSASGMRTATGSTRVKTSSRLLRKTVCRPSFGSTQATKLPPIQAQMVQFKARREVSIPCREGALPAEDYLEELERVVKVTFPDSARITYLGDSIWRTRLKAITFFTISATPVCDVKVYNRDDTLQIHSDRLLLDFSGLPEDFGDLHIQFNLQGHMQANARKGSQYRAGRQIHFNGGVSLSLRTELPLPFSLFPETLVTSVGDNILDTILKAMESALLKGVIADYESWCWKSVEMKRALRVTG